MGTGNHRAYREEDNKDKDCKQEENQSAGGREEGQHGEEESVGRQEGVRSSHDRPEDFDLVYSVWRDEEEC